MYCPTLLTEIGRVVSIVISRVTLQVGISSKQTLIDGQELMTRYKAVVRCLVRLLQLTVFVLRQYAIVNRFLNQRTVVAQNNSTMSLQLLQTVCSVVEPPADKVEATSELTTELFRTLYIGNLLKELLVRWRVQSHQ